jgi:tetratricopeptide (TPR) repeat protein
MAYPSRDEIRSLCTEQSFDRGVAYWKQGRIQTLDIDGGRIRATVRGTHDYDVSIDVDEDAIHTRCSCPYDYAGDCKHIVAVLLAVEDRDVVEGDETDCHPPGTTDIETLVEATSADDLRTFLLDVIEDDRDVRDRFVAFAGEDTGKTVYDYKGEIDRRFEDAAGRRGMIEYDTHVDFSQYHDLAETHRDRGRVEAATDIYRAIAETIRENMDRVDDSSGYYSDELERAVEGYAATVAEGDLDPDEKRPHIEYLCGAFVEGDYFANGAYEEALRTICTTRDSLEHWLALLDDVVDVSLDPSAIEARAGETTVEPADDPREVERRADEGEHDRDRTDDVLYASDFTAGPLTIDDFVGDALDVEHLAVGPLDLAYFVGDAFDELRVDDPSTVEAHTVTVDPAGSNAGDDGIVSSLRSENVLSAAVYLLEELGEEDALFALYEEAYLERTQFCKEYAERLIARGNEAYAIEVLEAGIETFRFPTELRWLVVDLYRNRDQERYRKTLKRLFLDHTEWAAYDELKDACEDPQWASIYEEFERRFENDRQRLIDMYVHEGDFDAAFAELKAAENLDWLRRYLDPVATTDPIEYFEVYEERLIPFAAGETGRRHYRAIIDHLEEMQGLVPDARFEAFVDRLRDEHSNRPAFLDELEQAGL